MIALIEKVLERRKLERKNRARLSDDEHTVVAYTCRDRENDKPFTRIDVFPSRLKQSEGPCNFSFPCADYHEKCQATYNKAKTEIATLKGRAGKCHRG